MLKYQFHCLDNQMEVISILETYAAKMQEKILSISLQYGKWLHFQTRFRRNYANKKDTKVNQIRKM